MLDRRTFLKRGAYVASGMAALELMAACGGGASAPAASGPAKSAAAATATPADDVTQVYEAFVKKEMPGVPIDLLRAAKQEGKLSAYTTVTEFNPVLVKTFQQKFPFIEVQTLALNGGAMVTRFTGEANANQNLADVVQYTSVSDAIVAVDQKLVLNYKTSVEGELEMSHGVPGYVVPVTADAMGIAYNSKKLSDADVAGLTKWEGLLDSRWDSKRVAVVEVMAGGSSQLLNYYFGKQFGARMWQRIAKGGLYGIFPGGIPAMDSVISGENDLVIGAANTQASAKFVGGAPLRWTNPQDWIIFTYSQFINAKAPHPSAAKLYQEFVLSPTGQQIFANFGGVSLRRGFKGASDLQKQSWYQPVDSTKAWPYADKDITPAMADVSKQWRSIIK